MPTSNGTIDQQFSKLAERPHQFRDSTTFRKHGIIIPIVPSVFLYIILLFIIFYLNIDTITPVLSAAANVGASLSTSLLLTLYVPTA